MTIETTASSNLENKKSWSGLKKHYTHDPELNHKNKYLLTEQSKHDRQFNQHVNLIDFDKFTEKIFGAYVKQHDEAKNISKAYQFGNVKRFLKVDNQMKKRELNPDQELVTKVGAYDQYNEFLTQAVPALAQARKIKEEDARDLVLKAISDGLVDYAKGFNKRNTNIKMFESWSHVDEEGAPHLHSRVMPIVVPTEKTKKGKIKKPSWSLNRAIKTQIDKNPELTKMVKERMVEVKAKNDKKLNYSSNQIRLGVWREIEDKQAMSCLNDAILKELPELGKNPTFKFVRKYEANNAPKLEVGRDHDEYVASKKALSDQKQKHVQLERKNAILEKKEDSIKADVANKLNKARVEYQNIKKSYDKAKDKQKQAESKRDETISQIKQAESRLNNIQSEYQKIQLSKQEAEDDRKNVLLARDKAKNEQKDAESKRDEALKTLAVHQNELNDLNNYQSLINDYKTKIENQETTIAHNNKILTNQQSKFDILDAYDVKIADKTQELNTNTARVKDLNKTIDDNNNTIHAQNDQINENKKILAENETKMAESKKELQDYTDNLENKKKSILDKQNKELRHQYEAHKNSYKSNLDKLSKSYQTKRKQYIDASRRYETQAKILPNLVSIYHQCAEVFFENISDENNEIFTFREHIKYEPVLDSQGNTQTIAHAKAMGVYKVEGMDTEGNWTIDRPTTFESIMESFNTENKSHILKAIKATAKKAFDLFKKPKNKQLLNNLDKLNSDDVNNSILNADREPVNSSNSENVSITTEKKKRPELRILPRKPKQIEDENNDDFDY